MPDINSQEFTDQLIYQEWETYARFAYEQFLNRGRGAVYIDFNEVRISTGPHGETNFDLDKFRYVPINNKDIVGQEMHDKMLAYNPSTEVVFVFRLRGSPVAKQGEFEMATTVFFVGNVNDKPSPKALYNAKHQGDTNPEEKG